MIRPSYKMHPNDDPPSGRLSMMMVKNNNLIPPTKKSHCCSCCRWTLIFCQANHQLIKQVVILAALVAIVISIVYLLIFTPMAVYILDRLNLRPFFLPIIQCHHCTNLTFKYLINNQSACTGQQIIQLNVVISHHANVRARNNIRNTWGTVREYRGHKVKTMFAFGIHEDHNLNHQLEIEDALYNDIIQGNFKDSYQTLTQKSIMVLHWFTNHCSNAKYLLKTDDDSFNHPKRFIDYLRHVKEDKFVGGYCFTVMPDRRLGSKYFIGPTLYPDIYYPTYCTGPGYILSQSAAVDILAVSPNVKYLPMEDVFVTGMCREAAKLTYTQIPGVVVGWDQLTKCDLATWTKNTHNIVPERMLQIWEDVKSADKGDCLPRNSLKIFLLMLFLGCWSRHINSLRQCRPEPCVELT